VLDTGNFVLASLFELSAHCNIDNHNHTVINGRNRFSEPRRGEF
jgi:hypothetical protein